MGDCEMNTEAQSKRRGEGTDECERRKKQREKGAYDHNRAIGVFESH